jgi:hypothetical protein
VVICLFFAAGINYADRTALYIPRADAFTAVG